MKAGDSLSPAFSFDGTTYDMHLFHVAPQLTNFKWPEALVGEFRDYLQLNPGELDSATDLQRSLMTAAGQWENATDEATLQTSFVQTVNDAVRTIYLMRSPFVSLTSVQYYASDDTLKTATDGVDFDLDPTGRVASIRWRSCPGLSRFKRPKITITFVAGFTAATLPPDVRFAVFSLAKWHYHNRTAYTTDKVAPMPGNFLDLAIQHKSGRGWV